MIKRHPGIMQTIFTKLVLKFRLHDIDLNNLDNNTKVNNNLLTFIAEYLSVTTRFKLTATIPFPNCNLGIEINKCSPAYYLLLDLRHLLYGYSLLHIKGRYDVRLTRYMISKVLEIYNVIDTFDQTRLKQYVEDKLMFNTMYTISYISPLTLVDNEDKPIKSKSILEEIIIDELEQPELENYIDRYNLHNNNLIKLIYYVTSNNLKIGFKRKQHVGITFIIYNNVSNGTNSVNIPFLQKDVEVYLFDNETVVDYNDNKLTEVIKEIDLYLSIMKSKQAVVDKAVEAAKKLTQEEYQAIIELENFRKVDDAYPVSINLEFKGG